ncbi:MAG: hypothetical protein D6809_02160, partial [Gammaproteobacteria bacterium]
AQGRGGRLLRAQLGLDFGSAFTKVALRLGGEHRVVVTWEGLAGPACGEGEGSSACLPGAIHWEGGLCLPGPGERTRRDLKRPLMQEGADPRDAEAFRDAACFLAWAIRYARAWLYRHPDLGPLARERRLAWELAIGCPTRPFRDEGLKGRFQRLAEAAWWLAGAEVIDEARAREAQARRRPEALGLADEPCVFPEFLAQLGGYVTTGQVQHDGPHALLDVGAHTVDAATFSLGTPLDQSAGPTRVVALLYETVRPEGTWELAEHRTRGTGVVAIRGPGEPCLGTEAFARDRGLPVPEVHRRDEAFLDRLCDRLVREVLEPSCSNTRWGAWRDRAWESSLPVFLTGGGAACPLYREALERTQQRLRARCSPHVSPHFRFRPMDLAAGAWRDVPSGVRRRASVALGLVEDLDGVEIRSRREARPWRLREPLSHEELYSEP